MTDPTVDALAAALRMAREHIADGHTCNDTRGDCLDHMEAVYRAALADAGHLRATVEDAAVFLDRVSTDTGYVGARAWAVALRAALEPKP